MDFKYFRRYLSYNSVTSQSSRNQSLSDVNPRRLFHYNIKIQLRLQAWILSYLVTDYMGYANDIQFITDIFSSSFLLIMVINLVSVFKILAFKTNWDGEVTLCAVLALPL
jgi:hypothetical protein